MISYTMNAEYKVTALGNYHAKADHLQPIAWVLFAVKCCPEPTREKVCYRIEQWNKTTTETTQKKAMQHVLAIFDDLFDEAILAKYIEKI